MSIKRKYKKLLRDPKLFFSDMLIKHHKLINKIKGRKKYDGQNQFTVVSAVYGVEKYLDDYFESLVKQNLDFKKHIHLVMVDDGSKDNSAAIIKKWQKKYPNNITYILKENGGQASARNLGLPYVKTKWVTFIDPDDFIDLDYFLSINEYLEQSKDDVAFIGCNLYFYMESTKQYKDTHPLKYKFDKSSSVYSCNDLEKNVHMSSSSAIFLTNVITDNNLYFDERIKPSFEDASLISYYLHYADEYGKAVFLQEPKYLYRKREDNSSTLDGAWSDKRKFSDVFIYGYLPLLRFYLDKYQKVPVHIQRQVLYDLVWYVKYLLGNNEKLYFLNNNEKDKFLLLFKECFEYIDDKTILDFNLAGIWFLHKVLMLKGFKKSSNFKQIAYIERVDEQRQQLLISFIADIGSVVNISYNDEDVIPLFYKKISQIFAHEILGAIHYCWIPLPSKNQKLCIRIDGKASRLSSKGKMYAQALEVDLIKKAFHTISSDAWVLMDRDIQADDNAEHLYRYIMKHYPEQKIYFALRKSSHDWSRLEKEGFNLLDFGSEKHETILRNCSKIISSHADRYVNNYFDDNSMMNKSFVFLQHGVIKDDLSGWLNNKKNMDLFVTSTREEYQSIATLDSPYIFTTRETILTGLPRHDTLWINKEKKYLPTILIMPTWRKSIVGEVIGDGNTRCKNNKFELTQYFQHWYSLLHSHKLAQFANKYGFKVVFAPHKNVEIYLDSFKLPSFIECWKASAEESMQNLFLKSTFMVTDYSSVAFEMAYLNKTTLYYQFDENEVFSGDHIYQKGYFDYALDGFGPKVNTEAELLIELEKICQNQGQIEGKYLNRIKNTFAYQDANNCQRVYEAICDLDKPTENIINLDILNAFARKAVEHNDIKSAISRCKQLLKLGDDAQKYWSYTQLLYMYYDNHQFSKLVDLLKEHKSINMVDSQRIEAKLYILRSDWLAAIDVLNSIEFKSQQDYCQLIKVSAFARLSKAFDLFSKAITSIDQENIALVNIVTIYQSVLHRNWPEVVKNIQSTFNQFSEKTDLIRTFKLELLLARAYRELRQFSDSNNALTSYEKHTKDDHECRTEIAYLAFDRGNYHKVVSQLDQAYGKEVSFMSINLACLYSEALYIIGKKSEALSALDALLKRDASNENVIKLQLKCAKYEKNWKVILSYESLISSQAEFSSYLFTLFLAYEHAGMYSKALMLGDKIYNDVLQENTEFFLESLANMAIMEHRWDIAEKALSLFIKNSRMKVKSDIWNKLLHVQLMRI